MTRPLLLTTGEPAGIGPELALMLAARGQLANTVAVGDPQMLRQRAALLGLAVEVVEAAPGGLDISSPGVWWCGPPHCERLPRLGCSIPPMPATCWRHCKLP